MRLKVSQLKDPKHILLQLLGHLTDRTTLQQSVGVMVMVIWMSQLWLLPFATQGGLSVGPSIATDHSTVYPWKTRGIVRKGMEISHEVRPACVSELKRKSQDKEWFGESCQSPFFSVLKVGETFSMHDFPRSFLTVLAPWSLNFYQKNFLIWLTFRGGQLRRMGIVRWGLLDQRWSTDPGMESHQQRCHVFGISS